MKNTVMVPLVFTVSCVACLVLLSLSGALADYAAFTALRQGASGHFFTAVLERALYLCPVAIGLALLSSFMFLMRHRSFMIISVLLVAGLAAASVALVIPGSYRLYARLGGRIDAARRYIEQNGGALLQPGVIQSDLDDGRVVWLGVSPDGTEVWPVIHEGSGVKAGDATLSVHERARFDPLGDTLFDDAGLIARGVANDRAPVRAQLAPPAFISSIARDTARVLDDFRAAWARGWASYLWTAGSFFLAVCALWVFCYATGWRLLNVLLVVSAFRVLLVCWSYAFPGPVHDAVTRLAPVPDRLFGPVFCASFSALTLLGALLVLVYRLLRRRNAGGSR